MFLCPFSGKKINSSLLCDGINHCKDATSSDECGCDNTTLCTDKRCIQTWQLCDGTKDCLDGSDECHCDDIMAAAMFHCSQTRRCVDKKLLCDGTIDCGSRQITSGNKTFNVLDCTDEELFGCNQTFTCHDAFDTFHGDVITRDVKTCVPIHERCDGKSDCDDGSDECGCQDSIDCPNTGRDVTAVLQERHLADWKLDQLTPKCLLRHNFCDGVSHCDAGSDEQKSGFGFKCHLNTSSTFGLCLIPQSMLDDDVIDCADGSDVCTQDGKSSCFRCFDGSLIISNNQVCDDIIDCPDLSDECLCEKKKQLLICDVICNPYDKNTNCSRGSFYCDPKWLPFSKVCDGHVDCLGQSGDPKYKHVDENYCVRGDNVSRHVISCQDGKTGRISIATKCDVRPECADFHDECFDEDPCEVRSAYCDHVTPSFYWRSAKRFHCDSGLKVGMTSHGFGLVGSSVCDGIMDCIEGEDEKYCPHRFLCKTGSGSTSIDIRELCDGNFNCLDKQDEMNCPEYFYCESKKPLFVKRSSMHDGKDDCDDKSDECPKHELQLAFASANQMIASQAFRVIIWIMTFLSLFGNFAVGCRQIWLLRHAYNPLRNSVAVSNNVLVLNLAVADFLTGIYLLVVALHTIKFSGVYCKMDKKWRTSTTCSNLGYLNSVATETSVVTLIIMTSVRLHTVYRPFHVVSVTKTIFLSISAWILVIFASLPPRLDAFSDYFSGAVWYYSLFQSSDIVNKQSLIRFITRLQTLTKNSSTTTPSVDTDWGWIGEYLWKHISKEPLVKLGYYSSHSVCIPNMFPSVGDPGLYYSVSVTLFNLAAFIYVIIAYIMIYKKATKQTKKLSDSGNPQVGARAQSMQRRIFRLVASNVVCWFPVYSMALLKLSKVGISHEIYAIAAIIFLPLNSALNPILYSNIFEMIWHRVKFKPEKENVVSMSTRNVTSV